MRAGIVTFHKADNYGAVLQAYALQKTLATLGVDSDFLEFQEPDRKAAPFDGAVRKGPPAFVARLCEAGKARTALFDAFRTRYMRCSPPLPAEQAGELNDWFDVFLAGSDQVWNLRLLEADERYFLPFAAPDKRISYAASFGMDEIPDQLKGWYAEQLAGFRAISVREERGRELVRELTGRDCAVCLDPVLLLDRADWQTLTTPCGETPYLFLYMVGYDSELAARARQEAEERGLELRTAMASFIPQYGLGAWSGVGVEQWLSMICGCSGVFTNSFHCTAFAMLFGRPVTTVMLKDSLAHRNGRLEELLRLGGAEHQGKPAVISAEDFALRIQERRQESLDYLRKSLGQGGICQPFPER